MGLNRRLLFVSLLSYVVVDENDPAFDRPTKPIGPVYSEKDAGEKDFPVCRTAKGYRRVVVSPKPVTIVEKREIRKLIEMGFIVICCGGGGIPVVREGRTFSGVDAVIDKDLASAKLAEEVGVDVFIMATDEAGAFLNYRTPKQELLHCLTVQDAEQYLKQGHFPPGTMGPKIEAAVQFVRCCGKRAVITAIDRIEDAVAGLAGTEIVG